MVSQKIWKNLSRNTVFPSNHSESL